ARFNGVEEVVGSNPAAPTKRHVYDVAFFVAWVTLCRHLEIVPLDKTQVYSGSEKKSLPKVSMSVFNSGTNLRKAG
ncbi:MAG: hypothetical protein KJ063_18680, partial [Anaerolineae bacterium]|nr:hypothetical protein [Anaerolineae bacterium]